MVLIISNGKYWRNSKFVEKINYWFKENLLDLKKENLDFSELGNEWWF